MRYLFLVQGEGRGHMTQAITLSLLLKQNNHEVVKVFVGKSERRVIPQFFYDKIGAPVETYDSPNFIVDKNQKGIRLLPSVIYNIRRSGVYFNSIRMIREAVKKFKPDVIINFYELVGGLYFLLHRPGIKHVCIGHQFLAYHPEFEFPKKQWMDRISFMLANKIFSFGADRRLALSFRALSDVPEHKVVVVPPLLRSEALNASTTAGDYILAYILNDGYREEITRWHIDNKHIPVHFFSDARNEKEEEVIHENLTWHKINDVKFLEMMKNCKAFSSTAGFESVCEAMYMRKPVYMVPTGGHFEQQCNAIDAVKSGAGISGITFDLSRLLAFIPQYNAADTTFIKWVDSAPGLFIRALTDF